MERSGQKLQVGRTRKRACFEDLSSDRLKMDHKLRVKASALFAWLKIRLSGERLCTR